MTKSPTDMLEDALKDAMSGLDYIKQHHGLLYGFGWDRVYKKSEEALAAHANRPKIGDGERRTETDSLIEVADRNENNRSLIAKADALRDTLVAASYFNPPINGIKEAISNYDNARKAALSSPAVEEVTVDLLAECMQKTWDDFVSDTRCLPGDFEKYERGLIYFKAGEWVRLICDELNRRLKIVDSKKEDLDV